MSSDFFIGYTPMKTCTKCGTVKPLTEYYKAPTKIGLTPWCKACWCARRKELYPRKAEKARAYTKAWRLRNPEKTKEQRRLHKKLNPNYAYNRHLPMYEYLKNLKTTNQCTDCKNYFPSVSMDYDHVRGEKYRNVSVLAWNSTDTELVDKEIAKCDLVCSNCHRIRTVKRTHEQPTKVKSKVALKSLKRRTRAKEYLDQIKQNNPCSVCNKYFPVAAMEFDHVDRTTKSTCVGELRGRSIARVAEEVAKCRLICSNCHRVKTAKDLEWD